MTMNVDINLSYFTDWKYNCSVIFTDEVFAVDKCKIYFVNKGGFIYVQDAVFDEYIEGRTYYGGLSGYDIVSVVPPIKPDQNGILVFGKR